MDRPEQTLSAVLDAGELLLTSGALIATLLKMPKTKALTSILCGVIVAGFIMLLGSQGVIGVAHLF